MSILDLQALPLPQTHQGTMHALGASNLSITICVLVTPDSQVDAGERTSEKDFAIR